MKPRYLLLAFAIAFGSGCFFSSQPVNDPALGSNCKAVTTGLMFLSKPDVTCDQPVQPPTSNNAPAPSAQ
jgi:hypothetical protein